MEKKVRVRGRGRVTRGQDTSQKNVVNEALQGPPKSDLWTPYLHDEFPPRSRMFTGSVPSFHPMINNDNKNPNHTRKRPRVRLFLLDELVPDCDETPLTPLTPLPPSKRMRANETKCPNERATTTTTLATTLPPVDTVAPDTWGASGWDYQYRPAWATEKVSIQNEGEEVGTFQQLAELLDGANLIYSLNNDRFFGLLRAAPSDVTNLQNYTWAPHTDIDDPKVAKTNPFIPQPTDPYYSSMSPYLPFNIPERDEVEGITRPSIKLPPDPFWKNNSTRSTTTTTPQRPGTPGTPGTPSTPTSERDFSQGSGASEYNAGDTKEDIQRFLSSQRWMGSSTAPKSSSIYFRESRMIHWLFKAMSICSDFKLDELPLSDLVLWNRRQPWWNLPSVQYARLHSRRSQLSDEEMRLLGDQKRYTQWHWEKKWDLIKNQLEYEVRLTADLLTILHYHQLPLICHVRRWNKKDHKYVMRWEMLSIRTATPSILRFTSKQVDDPTAPPPAAAAATPGAKKKRIRAPLQPKPSLAISAEQALANRHHPTYNVVCAIAVSNARRFGHDTWCSLQELQTQLISHVACLVISNQYPRGIVKFFSPQSWK